MKVFIRCLGLIIIALVLGMVGESFAEAQEINCADIPRDGLMVALVAGQSNSANFTDRYTVAKGAVYSFMGGRCMRAADPMPGVGGRGGSIWPSLGDKLIESGKYSSVMFVTVGYGGSMVREWSPRGRHWGRVLRATEDVRKAEFKFTHVLWHQGESDNMAKTKANDYASGLSDFISGLRGLEVNAPVIVAVASRCWDMPPSPSVRAGQIQVIENTEDVYLGPDTDRLGLKYRHDGCHFNKDGVGRVVDMWLRAIGEVGK